MEVHEFGKENNRKVVLIPGNMMCWRQFENVIPLLEKDYHVIAVSTDGYDGTGETTFTTAEASAEKLEGYIQEHLDGEIDLVFGESFGCATTGMLFHRQRVKVGSMILSGPQYMSLGPLTGVMKAIIPRNQYRLLYNIQTRKKLPLLLKLYTRTDDEKLLAQFIRIERFDMNTVQSREHNEHVPVWDHKITLTNKGEETEYTDEVEIRAGWKTRFIWLWARAFYAHRQRKWIRLLKEDRG